MKMKWRMSGFDSLMVAVRESAESLSLDEMRRFVDYSQESLDKRDGTPAQLAVLAAAMSVYQVKLARVEANLAKQADDLAVQRMDAAFKHARSLLD